MNVTYQQFAELQDRVMLLEGGNATIQVIQEADVSELTKKFDRLLDYLEGFFGAGNIKMTDIKRVVGSSSSSTKPSTQTSSSSLEIEDLRNEITRLSQSLRASNERMERLLNYLSLWIDAGDNLNMKDIKSAVE